MSIARQAKAAFEMAATVGIAPTMERVHNFGRARLLNRSRAAQFRRLNLTEPVVRDVLGSQMRLDPRQGGLDRDLLLDGIREPMATGHIMRMLKRDDVVLEIGANIGYYALLESRLCNRIYAVEPHPGNFARLNDNIALNAYDNIETYNLAFGSTPGEIPMRCSGLANWHSCRDAVAGGAETIMVPCVRIDDFMVDRQAPSFMKMDVEGFELEVLRGASKTLRSVRCVFLELHGDILSRQEIREVIDLLREAGLSASFVVQYDRPGLARSYPTDFIENIYAGDRGTFELFFSRRA